MAPGMDALRKIAECPVCMEVLESPKTLQCQHVFCKRCIEHILEFLDDGWRLINCPLCGVATFLEPTDTVDYLPVPYILKEMVDVIKENWIELHLSIRSDPDNVLVREFSEATELVDVAKEMKLLFGVPPYETVRLWNRWLDTNELLSVNDRTLLECGIDSGGALVMEQRMDQGAYEDVIQTVMEVEGYDKRKNLLEVLQSKGSHRTLVFVANKGYADSLKNWLIMHDYHAYSMNPDRLEQQLRSALQEFNQGEEQAETPILVAPAVSAGWLGVTDVKHVINFDLPCDMTQYYRRIEHLGDNGNEGYATSFFDPKRDVILARGLLRCLADSGQNEKFRIG